MMDESLLQRQTPNHFGAEQAVLSSMLIDQRCISQVVGTLHLDDFYWQQNQDAYEAIYHMTNTAQDVDVVTVKNAMMRTGKYTEPALNDYFEAMLRDHITSANIQSYLDILQDKTLLRNISATAEELTAVVQQGMESGTDVLEVAEQRIHSLRQGKSNNGLVEISEVLNSVYDHLQELSQREGDLAGHSTGLRDLDKAISGLNNSDLILLAARPGMGKTSMALNILLHVGKHSKKSVAFFSLEMGQEQLAKRLISTETCLDNKKLTTGKLTPADWEKVMYACSSLIESKILISDDANTTVAEIKSKCRRVDDLGLIIIDYLQLMNSAGGKNSSRGDNRQQVVSDISRAMKIMAKELNVPVICLSQLSRASEKRDSKRPVMSDLRDSGAIEQDADIIMFLYREDYYDSDTEDHNLAECIIAKNRHGETKTVELEWLPQFTTFRGVSHDTPPPY